MIEVMEAPQLKSEYSENVAKSLLRIGCVQLDTVKKFKWVSGIESPVYCDNRKVVSYVDVRKEVVNEFVKIIKNRFASVEIIAGIVTGGVPFGSLIAEKMNLPFIYVRQEKKEHGLKKQVEGYFEQGKKVVVIEDHISTGGSSINAIKALRLDGLTVMGLVSIMTYGFKIANEAFEEEKIRHYSICDLNTILEVAFKEGAISEQEKETILAFKNSR